MRNFGVKPHIPISKDKEEALVRAHREGREFANKTSASLTDAQHQAKLLFADKDEQDVFISGYQGELKRIAARGQTP
jgi:hypothetical protein